MATTDVHEQLAFEIPSDPTRTRLGELTLHATGELVAKDGTATNGEKSTGFAEVYTVTDDVDGSLNHTIHDTHWANGTRDVQVVRRNGSHEIYDHLVGRLRLTVCGAGSGGGYIALKQARVKNKPRATLSAATIEDLYRGCGMSIVDVLSQHGADEVMTWGELFPGARGPRNLLVATSANEPALFPVVAFVLTRIAPLRRHFNLGVQDLEMAA